MQLVRHATSSEWLFLLVVEDVMVDNCADKEIRLSGGPNEMEGRLEVCHNHVWFSVCGKGNFFNDMDRMVVCKSMGFSEFGEFSSALFAPQKRPSCLWTTLTVINVCVCVFQMEVPTTTISTTHFQFFPSAQSTLTVPRA